MQRIGNYVVQAAVHTTSQYIVYTAKNSNSPNTFLIKTLTAAEQKTETLAQLQHEYYLLERLNAISSHFPKVVDFISEKEMIGIVFAEEGYRPLQQSIVESPMSLETFLPLAIELVESVAAIHSLSIIHKHIIPKNIFYHPEKNLVQIYDFSIATELNRTMVPTDPPRLLQGTLEYMAPEQTGRMNRPLTQRADLYSLGVIFYEWLTGSVPFMGKEPMTIIFGHIATIPKTPREKNENVPPLLSDITMKLLSKPAEERYKSALGLLYDLKEAWKKLQEDKIITPFILAEKDIATQLELPDQLYGREELIKTLFNVFDMVCLTGENQLVTVKGYSGIGKTSLVRELVPKIALVKGFFANGKFDKFQQSDSYEGLRSALDKVVRYHLSLPEAEYQVFKHTLLSEMGGILPVVTEFIPRLTTIVGEQNPLEEVGIEATRNRFELAIRRFIKIASLKHPLVLFLDDMQWANHSMVTLLSKIIVSEDVRNLLVIISYRSNEVDDNHPLINFIESVKSKKEIVKIEVEGLTEESSQQLLQDMLYLPEEEVVSLSRLMNKKTEGNPFFLLMLLEELYQEKQLYFDVAENRWLWDEAFILNMSASDNVLDFVTRKILKLDKHVQDILHLAACIGNTFTIEELSFSQIGHAEFIAESLQPAIQEGLIIPTQLRDEWIKGVSEKELLNREYRFQHDKIQQSCYGLKSVEESKHVHLNLARCWRKAYKDNLTTLKLMMIADQFDKGLSYIADSSEKELVCQLNLQAGKVALQSAAYDVAYQYDGTAKSLLDNKVWQKNYGLAFAVFSSYISSAFLSHHFSESEMATEETLRYVNNSFDKAKILYINGDLSRAIGKIEIKYYEEALKVLGFAEVAEIPSKFKLILTVLEFKLRTNSSQEQFEKLSLLSNDRDELTYVCAERLAEESYFNGDILRWAYVLASWSNSTYSQHNILLRSVSYMIYSLIWPRKDLSKKLYLLSKESMMRAKNKEVAVGFYFATTVLHAAWHYPLPKLLDNFAQCIQISEQAGSLEFLAQTHVYKILAQSDLSLSQKLDKFELLKGLVRDISQRGLIRILIEEEGLKHLVEEGYNSNPDDLFREKEILGMAEKAKYSIGIYAFFSKKMLIYMHIMKGSLLLPQRETFYEWLPRINKANASSVMLPANFYLFLLETSYYHPISFKDRIKTRRRLRQLYKRVKSWVKLCPESFLPYHIMMKAEYKRLSNKFTKALELYDESMQLAREYHIKECEGIACQRALSLCVDNQKMEMAKPYADRAVKIYQESDAHAVVKILREKYHDLLSEELIEVKEMPPMVLTPEQKERKEEKERYALDVRSIILAADVISKEIQLPGLLSNVLKLLVENIGATRSGLCLIQKGSLWVEGFYDSEGVTVEILKHTHWQDAMLCQEALLVAWRERKEIILMDVSGSTELNAGEYFNKAGTKCLIAAPIIRGDHVVGVIYCENNISTNAFTQERIDILRALAIQMAIAVENSRLYTTFEKFVPKAFLSQLGQEFIFDIEQGDSIEKHMNVLFMDIRNFTGYSENHTATEAFKLINEYLVEVAPAIHLYHGFIDKFLGDGIMALFPTTSDEALRACLEMQQRIHDFSSRLKGTFKLDVGMALHYGPLMLGIVGEKVHMEGTVIGDTVNVASRLESFNKLYGSNCLISDSVKKRLLNVKEYHLRQIGKITLLGKKEPTDIWQVLDSIMEEEIKKLFIEGNNQFFDAYQHYLERQFELAERMFRKILQENPQDKVALFYEQYCQIYKNIPPPDGWTGEIEMTIK